MKEGIVNTDDAGTQELPQRTKFNQNRKVLQETIRYLLKKMLLIVLTIFVGTFITILLVNRPMVTQFGLTTPQLDKAVKKRIDISVRYYQMDHINTLMQLDQDQRSAVLNDYREELIKESEINKPYLIKHLLWTFNALKFDWGQIGVTNVAPLQFFAQGRTRFNLNEVLLQHLPFTLLLVGSSNLILFLIGLPLALILSQKTNSLLDRLLTWIAPISSIPSWVIGIFLIMIFAIQFKIFPAYGMFDTMPPQTKWGYIPIILKHMVLPVSSILISMFFQLVYSWRTIFVTFGSEDYVELGKAIGMKPHRFRRDYILKPTLPFVITSFSLLLISFWQMTMALEVIFQWQGIGWLFIKIGMPNFWGESMYPGELLIALSLIVLFAYLLGITVFVLDIVYVLVDPRIRLNQHKPSIRMVRSKPKALRKAWKEARTENQRRKSVDQETTIKFNFHTIIDSLKERTKIFYSNIERFLIEIKRFPSAILGFVIIGFLIIGSLYAIIALPYRQIGKAWTGSTMTGRSDIPKLAKPEWFNLFSEKKYLSIFNKNEQSENVIRVEKPLKNGGKQITIVYLFDYYYPDFPTQMNLYIKGNYAEKAPFVSLKWITPDGREYKLKGMGINTERAYDFEEDLPVRRYVSQNKNWKEWFNFSKIFPTPYYYVLFANPDRNSPEVVNGLYQLRISGITFEEASDIETEFVMLGQVYGLAGTDYLRRDLSIPLFWGMPFALIVGLFGSLTTIILSMVLAATGVWFGGWIDDLIQRLTEVNLVLPILAISVLAYAYLGISIWTIFAIVIFLNVFGAPLKSFRSVLFQIREFPYIEAARAYGCSSMRIIRKYMVPRIIPVLIPQLIILIPSFVFLEATLGLFNISTGLPTWGTTIYEAATNGALYGSKYWVLAPLTLLLISGFAFSLCGSAMEKILNPRLLDD
jgi:peptide/nickel transport system permease protein